ncbi:zinc ribbon domain-containing protein [Novosphingobium sp.]|uniref:Zn-ribbon domain-containing OB-fold protein n=1 Tax=Novosphingobium sp. TaxID=1874826 RepID=UPI00260DC31E|nr:zinc ribbon domain-containing protein [Novosphingobium sp.]
MSVIMGQLGAEAPYWEALALGRLVLQQCTGCGKYNWPAVWRCGECGSWDHSWQPQPLRGHIFTWTRTHHRFGGTEGFDLPFATALVTLGSVPVRLLGVIDGAEDGIGIGAAVTGRVASIDYGSELVTALRWTLA